MGHRNLRGAPARPTGVPRRWTGRRQAPQGADQRPWRARPRDARTNRRALRRHRLRALDRSPLARQPRRPQSTDRRSRQGRARQWKRRLVEERHVRGDKPEELDCLRSAYQTPSSGVSSPVVEGTTAAVVNCLRACLRCSSPRSRSISRPSSAHKVPLASGVFRGVGRSVSGTGCSARGSGELRRCRRCRGDRRSRREECFGRI